MPPPSLKPINAHHTTHLDSDIRSVDLTVLAPLSAIWPYRYTARRTTHILPTLMHHAHCATHMLPTLIHHVHCATHMLPTLMHHTRCNVVALLTKKYLEVLSVAV